MNSTKTLSEYYTDALARAIQQGGLTADHGTTFGPSTLRVIRPLYNRLVNNPVGQMLLEERGVFALVDLAERIAKGEIVANAETFVWYVLDRYAPKDCDRYQITLERLYAESPLPLKYRESELISWLLGYSIKLPEVLSFWPTHGMNVLTIMGRKH